MFKKIIYCVWAVTQIYLIYKWAMVVYAGIIGGAPIYEIFGQTLFLLGFIILTVIIIIRDFKPDFGKSKKKPVPQKVSDDLNGLDAWINDDIDD